MTFNSRRLAAWCATVLLAGANVAAAQTLDQLQCFKSRDPLKVDVIANLESAQLGRDSGCKISRAAFVCLPASSSMASASVIGQALEDARICYKVKCPYPSAPDIQLGDQFGTRVFTGLKTSFLCTPAGEEPPSGDTTTTTLPSSSSFQNIGTYGVPSSGYPNYLERAALVYVNAVRMAPLDYRAKYTYDTRFSLAAVDALEGYPAVEPVRSAHGLNLSSRSHSQDMLLNGCFQHSSCDGTSWVARLNSFYSGGAGGENIAAGIPDPRVLINAWLCDSTGTACCKDFATCASHRRNIMTASFRASGMGYATNGSKHYWTQDLSGTLVPLAPATPLIDGAHLLIGTTSTKFLANYRDTKGAPRSVTLVLGGVARAMTLDLGSTTRGSFAASLPRATGCRSYHFEAVDSGGRKWRYPASGEFRTWGEGTCAQNHTP